MVMRLEVDLASLQKSFDEFKKEVKRKGKRVRVISLIVMYILKQQSLVFGGKDRDACEVNALPPSQLGFDQMHQCYNASASGVSMIKCS